jgi:parallel beta-helix repeat protein
MQCKIRACAGGLAVEGDSSYLYVAETTVLDCGIGLEANAGTTQISRCTFAGNGDGLRLHAAATAENTIVCGSSGSGVFKDPSPDVPTPDVRFCDLWDNGTDSVNLEPAASCFSADPVFLDPESGYYCLGYGSPCVNVGTADGATPDGSTDIGRHAAVTVGGSGADFEHLQPAVDAVSHRGSLASVLVGPGTYKGQAGHVRMRSPVALVGASPSSVTLDGTGYFSSGIYVSDGAAGGSVSGLTIANQFARGIRVELRSLDGTPVPFLIKNNIIRDNGRSAIHVFYDSSPRVLNNTLVNNARNGVWVEPTCTELSSPYIANNIIVGNGQSGIADSPDNATTPWADYNNVYGNTIEYYGFISGPHHLAVDPGFVAPAAGDYHLGRCSPCLDMGDPASDYSREPEPNGGRLNLGAYGNTPEARISSLFADVPCGHWACDQVEACVAADIVGGYPDGLYRPDLNVTRDQMAVYVSRSLAGGDENVPDGPSQATFDDVPADHWAYDYVECAFASNVVQGYDPVTYAPDVTVTRDQMAVYIARAMVAPTGEAALADYVPADPRDFPDVPDDSWAYRHIEYCVENGVVQGYPDGSYYPANIVTRDQMAVYIARAFELPL